MDNFFDSLEQQYAKKQKGLSKAGGSKNKTSGGKGTRKGRNHCYLFLYCVVILDS